MADSKLSDLTELATTPAASDELYVNDGGTSKKIQYSNLVPAQTPEGTAILSTGEAGGTKFLREDGDDSSSWQSVTEADISDLGTYAALGVANEFTKTQNFNATTLTDAASIAWDLESNQVCSVTLGDNRALANPTNMKDGATYILIVKQDATGSRTLSYGANYKWEGGTAPTLSTGANAVDILTFVSDGSSMFGVISQDFS